MATNWVWGTVTQVIPTLAVQLDGESTALPITPDSLVPLAALAVGTRVRGELTNFRLVIHGAASPNGTVTRGSTTARDAFYGTPSTTAQQVALANQVVQWFNTDLGWLEGYYAVTGAAGLTALGLAAAAPAGWYPVGRGPECILEPNAQIATPSPGATAYVQGWPGTVTRRGGATWFTNNFGAIFCNIAGYYDLRAWTLQQAGSGTMNFHLVVLNNAGTTERTRHDGGAFDLNSTLFSTVDMSMQSKFMNAGDQLLLRAWSGGPINVHVGSNSTDTRGQLIARYVRPPLVSV